MKTLLALCLVSAVSFAQTQEVYLLTRSGGTMVKVPTSWLKGDSLEVQGAPAVVDTNVIATQNDLHAEVDSVKANRALVGHTHPYTLVAKLANDASTGANTTPISLSGLVFNFVANSTYRVEFYGSVSPAAATTGCGFQFDVSAAVTAISVSFTHQLANTGTLSGGSSIADDASAGVSSGMPANGGVYPVVGAGIIITGANTGTAQLRFRSETTAVTTAKAGFLLVVEKLQ